MRQSLPKPEATSPTWPLAVLRLAKSNASARVLLAEGEPGGRTTPGNVTCGLRQFLSAASAPVCCFLLITTCCQGRARGEGRGGTPRKHTETGHRVTLHLSAAGPLCSRHQLGMSCSGPPGCAHVAWSGWCVHAAGKGLLVALLVPAQLAGYHWQPPSCYP